MWASIIKIGIKKSNGVFHIYLEYNTYRLIQWKLTGCFYTTKFLVVNCFLIQTFAALKFDVYFENL